MKSRHNNILIIGFGHHSKRIHFPIIESLVDASVVGLVDLDISNESIVNFFRQKERSIQSLFFKSKDNFNLDKLTAFAKDLNVTSVVISTDPDSHCDYAKWALVHGYSVLLDKPVHTEKNAAHNIDAAKAIHQEYASLLAVYEESKKNFPYLACEVLSQRRHHPAYKLVKSTIEEIYKKTRCPITYYYSFHNDGQWRMPKELSEIDYHGFSDGYGKASHSGYHFFDLLNWFSDVYHEDMNINLLRTKSWGNFPENYLKQIGPVTLKKVFRSEIEPNNNNLSKYGEIDVMSTIELCNEDSVITHAQIDLLHSGLSSRSWSSIDGRNLYKGNGRVRHEQHYISIGPFASISLTSWQSKPFEAEQMNSNEIFKPGHEFNLDITICRNSSLVGGEDVKTLSLQNFYDPILTGYSRGHQEDARRNAIIEFNGLVNSGNNSGTSSLPTHALSSQIMSGVYESLVTENISVLKK